MVENISDQSHAPTQEIPRVEVDPDPTAEMPIVGGGVEQELEPTQVLPTVDRSLAPPPAPTEPIPLPAANTPTPPSPPTPPVSTSTPVVPTPRVAPIEASSNSESVEPPEPPETPDNYDDKRLQEELGIQGVDVSKGINPKAEDYADEQIRQRTSQKGIKTVLKRIWVGSIAKDYYRQKFKSRGEQKIVTEQNLGTLSGVSQQENRQAMMATIDRFAFGDDRLLHSGETNRTADEIQTGEHIESLLKEAVKQFATGHIDQVALIERKDEIFGRLGTTLQETDRKSGRMFVDNVVEVAINAKAAVEHGVGLDRIDAAMQFSLGDARMGVRTEQKTQMADKLAEKLAQTRITGLISESSVGLIAGVVIGVGKFSTRKLATSIIGTATFGTLTGALAASREGYHMQEERRLDARQIAEGGEVAADSKRREQLAEARYEMVASQDLLDALASSTTDYDNTPDSLNRLVGLVADVTSRITMSDEFNCDLIQYKDERTVEQERLALDVALAQAEDFLSNQVETTDDATLQALGIDRNDIDGAIAHRVDIVNGEVLSDMSEKDAVFRKLRIKRMASAAVVGATVGVLLGSGGEELRAFLDHGVQGLFEHASPGQHSRTELAAMFNNSHLAADHKGFDNSSFKLGNNALDLPAGYHVATDAATGHHTLIGPGNTAVGAIGLGANGHLNEASQRLLEQQGFKTSVATQAFQEAHTEVSTTQVDPSTYVANHSSEFTEIHRQLWYDNDTPYSDYNELKGYWGNGGSGINAQGSYVFDVSHMTANGSFEGSQMANAPELIQQHQLFVAVSLNEATQNNVILVPIDAATGTATFDPSTNPAFAAMFENINGQAHFNGGFLEVVQNMGQNPAGGDTIRPLATLIGGNNPSPNALTDTISNVVHVRGEHVITHIEAPAGTPVEITPVVPVRYRTGLEDLKGRPDLKNPNLAPAYYSGKSLPELRRWVNDGDRLQSRQKIINEDGTTSWVEADGTPVERSVERERAAIEVYLAEEQQSNPGHYALVESVADGLEPMLDNCRVSVLVPAWMEANNLKAMLEEYTAQQSKDGSSLNPDLYEINILVNRKTGATPDESVQVIQTFISDFEASNGFKPKVNFHDIELEPPLNNVGYARKVLADAILVRSARRTGQAESLYIESEDADLVHVDPRTITNLIETMDSSPHLDAVRGITDRSPEDLKENDYLFFRRRLWDFAEHLARGKQFRDPRSPSWNYMWNRVWTNGWNSGFSAEGYALIEGYDAVEKGEDMIIGEKLAMVRGDGEFPNLEVVGRVYSRSDGSPRRFIREIVTGKDAYSPDFSDEETNRVIRENTTEQLLDTISKYARITPENQKAFADVVQGYTTFARSVTPTQTDANQLMKRLMFWLGFKKDDYVLTDSGDVTVDSWDNVRDALENYRVRYA